MNEWTTFLNCPAFLEWPLKNRAPARLYNSCWWDAGVCRTTTNSSSLLFFLFCLFFRERTFCELRAQHIRSGCQLTQWFSQNPVMMAGPRERAGFILAPENRACPENNMLAVTLCWVIGHPSIHPSMNLFSIPDDLGRVINCRSQRSSHAHMSIYAQFNEPNVFWMWGGSRSKKKKWAWGKRAYSFYNVSIVLVQENFATWEI